jgi:hypothetical protein
MMSKIRFDPSTYHFYVRSGSGQAIRAKAAGFRWDPLRSRYYTADPRIAKSVADCGDRYVKHLLADILGVTVVTDLRTGNRSATAQH